MLKSGLALQGSNIEAVDGPIGEIKDLLFDDANWTVRYVVVDTGAWLPGRKVLLPPATLKEPDWVARKVPATLTRDQVRNSPDIDTDQPVSGRQAMALQGYFGLPYPYWTPRDTFGVPPPVTVTAMTDRREKTEGDPHLRSMTEVKNYYIEAVDGDLGHVEDFIVDYADWVVRYLVVDTKNWWPGKKVLLPPQWVDEVNWDDVKVRVELERELIRRGPTYNPQEPIDRDLEEKIYGYYGRRRYWER